jgi:hypothetical protein
MLTVGEVWYSARDTDCINHLSASGSISIIDTLTSMSTKYTKDVCETCGDVKVIVGKKEISIPCTERKNVLRWTDRSIPCFCGSVPCAEHYIGDNPGWGDVFTEL